MAKRTPRKAEPTPVEAFKHKESRINIPTEELRDFIVIEGPTWMLYLRAASRVTTPVTSSR